jgi:hypothetical protein
VNGYSTAGIGMRMGMEERFSQKINKAVLYIGITKLIFSSEKAAALES